MNQSTCPSSTLGKKLHNSFFICLLLFGDRDNLHNLNPSLCWGKQIHGDNQISSGSSIGAYIYTRVVSLKTSNAVLYKTSFTFSGLANIMHILLPDYFLNA